MKYDEGVFTTPLQLKDYASDNVKVAERENQ
jgi:hypothetical protein